MSIETCPKCGTKNETKSAWCEKCLHMFHEYGENQTILCPECKHKNAYVDDYCEVCHEPLKPGQWE